MLASLGLQYRDISILFTDDAGISVLNHQFFNKDRPTNVISFSYLDGLQEEVFGDLIISVETAAREAEKAGMPFYERLFALIVHGIVHIMGYDHERGGSQTRKMRYREKKLMEIVLSHDRFETLAESGKPLWPLKNRRA